jgi:hypothetical protein
MGDRQETIGVVGVDSGTLIICDPCYMSGDFEREFDHKRLVRDRETNQLYEFGQDFSNYQEHVPGFGLQTYNDLIREGRLENVPYPETIEFNRANVSACLINRQYAQFHYPLGHAGIGVGFRSGLGDGLYEVIATIGEVNGWGERIKKVEIILVDDDD